MNYCTRGLKQIGKKQHLGVLYFVQECFLTQPIFYKIIRDLLSLSLGENLLSLCYANTLIIYSLATNVHLTLDCSIPVPILDVRGNSFTFDSK